MTHIPLSEDNIGMYDSYTGFMDISGLAFDTETCIHPLAERLEQRHLALRTVKNLRLLSGVEVKARLELQKSFSQRVVLPDNRVITYQIDARGRRIGKKVDDVFEYGFICGDQLNPIAKVDESGNIIESYIYGLKSNVPEYVVKDGVKYKVISNHLGSPLAVWQEGERTSPVLERKYDSFGNILEESGSFELVFGFAGGIWDKDTGVVRFGVRDYDSETGRWTSKEPLGFEGSRNFYVYAGNDGVNFVDLDGRNPFLNPDNWVKFYEIIESYWNKLDPLIKWLIGGITFDYLKEEFTVDNIINGCHQISNAINNLLMSPIQIFVIFPSTYGKLNYGLRYSNKNFPPIRLDSKPRRIPYE